MVRYNTWLPGKALFAYQGSFVKALAYAERSDGGRMVTDQVTVPDTDVIFGIKAEFTTPAMAITRPPKVSYSSTTDFTLILKDATGWLWAARCPKQTTVKERGWSWAQFNLASLQEADKASRTPPTVPASGAIQAILFQRLANIADISNTTPQTFRLAYIAGRSPVVAQSGSIDRVSLLNESTAAMTWRVGDVKLSEGSRKPIRYAGAVPYNFASGGSNRNPYSSAPFRGPYIVGQQAGTPWVDLKDNVKLNGMLDLMLESQVQFRERHPDGMEGPFLHSFVPQTWDGGVDGQHDSWVLEAPDGNPTWGGWQYRAFEGMARTWYASINSGATVGVIEKARTVCVRFFEWVHEWLSANPDAYYLPSKWTPIGWKDGNPLPDTAYLDPHGTEIEVGDLAVVIKGAIYSGLAGVELEKAKYVILRCLQVLARMQVSSPSSPMRGSFTLRPQNYDVKGYEHAEALDALALGLRYPQYFPKVEESLVDFTTGALDIEVAYADIPDQSLVNFLVSTLEVEVEYDPSSSISLVAFTVPTKLIEIGYDINATEPPVTPNPTALTRLTTFKNQFVNGYGDTVRLRSVNWFGGESDNRTPHGTWQNPYTEIIDDMKAMGFNCIRLPISGSFNNTALTIPETAINLAANPDMEGKNAYEVIDMIIKYALTKRMYVVLDHHRAVEGAGADGSPISGSYTLAKWIETWVNLATYFRNNINVVGADVHNEPHNLDWNTWASYCEQCGNAIHAVNSDWIIFVEGVGNIGDDHYWWGGQLAGVKTRPVVLTRPNRLAYSPHEYGQSVGSQTWLAYDGQTPPANYPNNLNAVWKSHWGFIFEEEIAPIWIGEFGGHFGVNGLGVENKPHAAYEKQWLARLTTYLNGDYTGDGSVDMGTDNFGMSFAYWSYNPNSADTGGLVQDDWLTHQYTKLVALAPLFTDVVPDPEEEEETWPAVAFPGRRLAMVGDSITWYNTAYVPPKSGKFEGFGFGMGGYWTSADQILQGRLVFEHGASADPSGRHHGYNFAIAGTKVSNWWKPIDIPINDGVEQVGPMYAALDNLSKFDVCLIMGGTNDLSGNASATSVITLVKKAASDLAKEGKWVFILTIPPRSRDALQGYTLAQQDSIRARLVEVNQGLKDWVADKQPPNVWISDAYADCLGPNGVDPAGHVSSAVDASAPSTFGNYRPDAPGIIFMHDGLHPGPAGGYAIGKKLAETMLAAGIPARTSATALGPLTLGANLLPNPNMTFTQYDMQTVSPTWNYSRIGWATGLGAHQKVGNLANGYPNGKVPDFWHFYKANNTEDNVIGVGTGGTYSNFNAYTWADMVAEHPLIASYTADATWPVGSIQVSIITDEGSPAIKIDYNIPATGNKNEAFVLNAMFPQDQHGVWDNYGWMGADNGAPRPNTAFAAGDRLVSEADIKLVGVSPHLVSCQTVMYLFAIVPQSSYGAKRLSFGNHPFFWPPGDMDKIRFHTANRTMHVRSPVVQVPAYLTAETIRYGELRFEFCVDASVATASGTIIVKNPAVRKVISGAPL